MRTQIGIVGAGPAGLMLSHLLHREGIDSVVLEARSRDYIEGRIRAGVVEQWVADLLVEIGLGERMRRTALLHRGINLSFSKTLHHLDFQNLVGKSVTVYGQQEVVKDLIAARLAAGGSILFEVGDVSVRDVSSERPIILAQHDGQTIQLNCDFVAGCDGFHGICRASIAAALNHFDRDYPFAWLGILSQSPPPSNELIYAHHDRGFALFSMREPERSRLYLQCRPDDDLDCWSNERIWDELHRRLDGTATLVEGPILQKGVTPMRSFVVEPMQAGRLFLAGDAAHIVPPTGAKGMNLAIADVRVLARGLAAFYRTGRRDLLARYSQICLRRVWQAQRFSWWMTTLLHRLDEANPFDLRRQQAELEYVTSSPAASRSLAENYVGLPFDM
jgi:p-hydroxybenzoate 3-monooxygenase